MKTMIMGVDWRPAAVHPSTHSQAGVNKALKSLVAFARQVSAQQLNHLDPQQTGYHRQAFSMACNAFLLAALIAKAEHYAVAKTPKELACCALIKYLRKTQKKSLQQAKAVVTTLCHTRIGSKTAHLFKVGYQHWNDPYALRNYFQLHPPAETESQQWAERVARQHAQLLLIIRMSILSMICALVATL